MAFSTTMRKAALWLLALGILVEHLWLWFPALRAWVFRYQRSPEERGREIAERLGCFSCHGADGRGGIPNPGSRWETVPGFAEQTLMMFVQNEREVREYILYGAPERKRRSSAYREEMEKQAVRMPAYEGWISAAELEDLLAYLRAVSGLLLPPEGPEARGEQVARRLGCLGCHGPMGRGGRKNPGSWKGYIPGFFGDDFRELVRDDAELEEWILDGKIGRLERHPVGKFFLERQVIRMPAFRKFLAEGELEELVAYVRWLERGEWANRPLLP
ncbi:MAG: hypothetical protein KatS3mg076_1208 [Candidatus Binatia bacterium]|nr:MAG: hypothetical protein KatS3mg076_1208 [Candidatus Binatia bacterium]